MKMLSRIRLGAALGRLDVPLSTIDDLFVQERLAPADDDPNRQDRGNLWVFLGMAGNFSGLSSSPDFKLIGGFSDRRFGAVATVINDISSPADGIPDLAVSAPEAAYQGQGQGAVYIFEGRTDWPAELTTSQALYQVVGSHRDAWFGAALATVDDFDGDGYSELVIGEPNYTEGGTENDYQRGRFYLFNALPDRDEDGDAISTLAGDCDDKDPEIRPTAAEVCDGVDNNCNHQTDEGCDEGDDDDSPAPEEEDDFSEEPAQGCQCAASSQAPPGGMNQLLALLALLLVGYWGRRTE